jgi:hypothetical protein
VADDTEYLCSLDADHKPFQTESTKCTLSNFWAGTNYDLGGWPQITSLKTVLGPTNRPTLSTPTKSEHGVRKNPIVLVCEDDPLVRMVIVDYLSDHGCTVMEATSGEERSASSMALINNSMFCLPTFVWVAL